MIFAQSAIVMNRMSAELEFFPISIAGIAIGQGFHQRPNFSRQWDCKQEISCKGWLRRTLVRAQLVAGGAGFFGALIGRREWVTAGDNSRPFGEEGMGVVGKAGKDTLNTTIGVLGYQLRPRWSVGAQVIRCSATELPNRSVTSLLFVNHLRGSTSYLLGAGTYASDHVSLGFTLAAMFSINEIRSIGFL
jgi:hypothetical protein